MRHSSAPSPWKGRFRHEPRVRARRYNESIIRLIGDAACGSTAGFDPEADVLLSRFSYGRSVSLLTDVRIAPCEPKFDELRYLENPRIAAYRRPGARTHISRFVGAPSSEIDERLRDLKREWDIERTLEANVARVALLGLGLSIFDRRFLALPVAVVATCLLQHALQAWCSQLPVFRRLGVRTAKIHADMIALRTLRGDLRDLRDEDPDEALARADT